MNYRFSLSLSYTQPLEYSNNFPVMPILGMPENATLIKHEFGEAVVEIKNTTLIEAHQTINQILSINLCLSEVEVYSFASI